MKLWRHRACGTRTTVHCCRSGQKLRKCFGTRREEVMPEIEARSRFPNLTVASLGAQKKEKPGGVLFDGTNGNFVNTSTHLRDRERAPAAPDLKRLMREKAKTGEVTFGLTADVKEAHRQVPIHPDDWHLLKEEERCL